LAGELKLTNNAVRAHLATLERDGLVRQTGLRAGVRKPNSTYGLTEEAERLFPKPYGPVLAQVLAVLGEKLPTGAREQVLRDVGRRLAGPHMDQMQQLPLDQRLAKAVDLLGQLGGLAELRQEDGRYVIRGRSCPLGQVVREEPEACKLAEALLSELLGVPVRERCKKGPAPRCCFEVEG
jgi:predicted ArsR family transcriptional regulator